MGVIMNKKQFLFFLGSVVVGSVGCAGVYNESLSLELSQDSTIGSVQDLESFVVKLPEGIIYSISEAKIKELNPIQQEALKKLIKDPVFERYITNSSSGFLTKTSDSEKRFIKAIFDSLISRKRKTPIKVLEYIFEGAPASLLKMFTTMSKQVKDLNRVRYQETQRREFPTRNFIPLSLIPISAIPVDIQSGIQNLLQDPLLHRYMKDNGHRVVRSEKAEKEKLFAAMQQAHLTFFNNAEYDGGRFFTKNILQKIISNEISDRENAINYWAERLRNVFRTLDSKENRKKSKQKLPETQEYESQVELFQASIAGAEQINGPLGIGSSSSLPVLNLFENEQEPLFTQNEILSIEEALRNTQNSVHLGEEDFSIPFDGAHYLISQEKISLLDSGQKVALKKLIQNDTFKRYMENSETHRYVKFSETEADDLIGILNSFRKQSGKLNTELLVNIFACIFVGNPDLPGSCFRARIFSNLTLSSGWHNYTCVLLIF